MIECMRLIIAKMGTRERERERLKVGRSEKSRTRITWAAVKEPHGWGRKWRLQLLLLTPPTPEGEDPPSLRPKPNPKTEELFRKCRGR